MTHFLVTWAATALGLLIISQLRWGIETRNLGAAFVAGLVLGLLNAIVRPILGFLTFPITILTLGLFALVLNTLMVMLMAAARQGRPVAQRLLGRVDRFHPAQHLQRDRRCDYLLKKGARA